MDDKKTIRELVDATEAYISEFKNTYPQNTADCWRKYTPYLLLLGIYPISGLASHLEYPADIFIVIVCCVVFYLSIVSIVRNFGKVEPNFVPMRSALDTLNKLEPWQDHEDISTYCKSTRMHILEVASKKQEAKSGVLLLSFLILLVAYVATSLTWNHTVQSPLFGSLEVAVDSEFKAVPYQKEGGVSAESPVFNVRSDGRGDIYLEFSGLKLPDSEPSAVYTLNFVDKDGVPEPYLPEFVFSGRDVIDGLAVSSNILDGNGENMLPAYYTLKAVKSGKMNFVVEKIK